MREREGVRSEAEILGFGPDEPEAVGAPPPPRSWRPEVIVAGQWKPNDLRFHTEAAALDWAREMADPWGFAFRAAKSDDPPNRNDEVLAADRESWRLA